MNKILQEFIEESTSKQWEPSWPVPNNLWGSDWPWFPIDFDGNFNAMHKECIINDALFVGHRQLDKHLSYNHEGWSALTLHGIAHDKTEHWPQYGFNSKEEANYRWTDVVDKFPTCVKFLKSLNFKNLDRVRIMKLSAGGYIMPHTDGPGRIFGPLNIAINNPKGCEFYFRKWGRVPFRQGIGNVLDIGNEHIVWNNSKEDRYHFIVHGEIDNELLIRATSKLRQKYERY
jgi:hypothetical protein